MTTRITSPFVSEANLRSACAIAPPLNSQAFYECQGGAKRARTSKELSFARSKELAFSTIHYAVECLMHSEKKSFAIEVINEEGNGLTEAQKQAISTQLLALADRPKTVRELNQLENRLIGVLQPATLQFLKSSKLLAEVLDFFLDSQDSVKLQLKGRTYNNPVRALSIQLPRSELNQSIIKRHLRDRDNLYLDDIQRCLEIIHGRRIIPNSGTYWWINEIVQLLAWAPHFMELIIQDDFKSGFLLRVAEAINDNAETQFRKITDQTSRKSPLAYASLRTLSPRISELDVERTILSYEISELVEILRSVKKLSIKLQPDALPSDDLEVVKKLKLTSLSLTISLKYEEEGFSNDNIEILNTLHLEALNLGGSDGLTDQQLLLLKGLTHLHTLNLYDCEQLTVKGIAAFAKGNTSIRTIYYELRDNRDHSMGLSQEEVNWLESTFPHIRFESLNDDGGTP